MFNIRYKIDLGFLLSFENFPLFQVWFCVNLSCFVLVITLFSLGLCLASDSRSGGKWIKRST